MITVTSSPWEDELLSYDVVVVGAGLIGLSSAIEIAERNRSTRIAILERGLVPTGASTRNAGFACFGSAGEILSDIARMGQEGALGVVAQRIAGLQKLKQRTADSNIGYEEHGGHELFFDDHPALRSLPELNTLVEPLLGKDVFTRRDDLINEFMLGERVKALVHIKHEATVHSGLLINALWTKAEHLGIRVFTGALVTSINGEELTVHTIAGERTIEAKTVVLATNGNMSQITFNRNRPKFKIIDVDASKPLPTFAPARGQVLLTTPIAGLPLRGSFHFNDGYYYFRNLNDRVLFGGGRNTDFAGETTFSMSTTEPLQQNLEDLLGTVIAPGRDFTIDRRWSGTMAFAEDKQPLVRKIADNAFLAFGCNGMGVAIGSNIGAEVADHVSAL